MKRKIAICKINMIGAQALVLGLCRYDDEEEFWEKFQLFTGEEYHGTNVKPVEDSWCNTQEKADRYNKDMNALALGLLKYQGECVQFDSIDRPVPVFKDTHEFSLARAPQVEITRDRWQEFDSETWGK